MSSEEQSTIRAGRPSRILVVDDEEPLRRSIARILSRDGHEVILAEDGAQAIGFLKGPTFDVVMTDLSMPGMTGLELLRAIRGFDLDVPVVLLTRLSER